MTGKTHDPSPPARGFARAPAPESPRRRFGVDMQKCWTTSAGKPQSLERAPNRKHPPLAAAPVASVPDRAPEALMNAPAQQAVDQRAGRQENQHPRLGHVHGRLFGRFFGRFFRRRFENRRHMDRRKRRERRECGRRRPLSHHHGRGRRRGRYWRNPPDFAWRRFITGKSLRNRAGRQKESAAALLWPPSPQHPQLTTISLRISPTARACQAAKSSCAASLSRSPLRPPVQTMAPAIINAAIIFAYPEPIMVPSAAPNPPRQESSAIHGPVPERFGRGGNLHPSLMPAGLAAGRVWKRVQFQWIAGGSGAERLWRGGPIRRRIARLRRAIGVKSLLCADLKRARVYRCGTPRRDYPSCMRHARKWVNIPRNGGRGAANCGCRRGVGSFVLRGVQRV